MQYSMVREFPRFKRFRGHAGFLVYELKSKLLKGGLYRGLL